MKLDRADVPVAGAMLLAVGVAVLSIVGARLLLSPIPEVDTWIEPLDVSAFPTTGGAPERVHAWSANPFLTDGETLALDSRFVHVHARRSDTAPATPEAPRLEAMIRVGDGPAVAIYASREGP